MVNPAKHKPLKSASETWFGWHTIYGREGDSDTPYMTRIWIGRLRLHIFYRGDADDDHHDHPWDFWTFPFTSYVEEVVYAVGGTICTDKVEVEPGVFLDHTSFESRWQKVMNVVPAWRWTFRPAEHCHRVIAPYSGFARGAFNDFPASPDKVNSTVRLRPIPTEGKIVTLVWRSGRKRDWGFRKNRDGKWCWIAWKQYVFGGGKDAPCA